MMRYGFPSIRTMLHMALIAPVQCRGQSSVNLSAGDQMLKYGSWTTSGTAGGRNVFASSASRFAETATMQQMPPNKENKRACFFMERILDALGQVSGGLFWWRDRDSGRKGRFGKLELRLLPNESMKKYILKYTFHSIGQ